MLTPRPDYVVREVDPPEDAWCDSGHHSTGTYKRDGPTSKPEPIRFFRFTGFGKDGVYCEPCLVVMYHMVRLKKAGKIGE